MSELELGPAIRLARKGAGLTLGELAGRIGVSPATLSRVETGKLELTAERLRRSSAALGVDIEEYARRAEVQPDEAGRSSALPTYRSQEPGDWRRYAELRLDAGLRAALDLFLEVGYHGTSVRDIARRSGLSVPGLYHHYPRKDDLLLAIMEVTMSEFHARLVAAREEGRTSRARFEQLVECFALFHSYRHELAFIGASEMRSLVGDERRRIAEIRSSCQRMMTDAVLDLHREGRAAAPEPEDAARAVVTMLVGIANWYRADGVLTPEEIARRYVGHASGLVGVRRATRG